MDPKFLKYYNKELQHIRETCGEFAKEYPKIAGRLGLDSFECVDPYVERIIEGFAFMASRVQLKVDSEFSRFTRHLLESIYPNYLCPIPSTTILIFEPDKGKESATIPRNSKLLQSQNSLPRTNSRCEFRSCHDLTLWPIEINSVKYLPNVSAIETLGIQAQSTTRSAISISITSLNGQAINKLKIDTLGLHLCGVDQQPFKLYEHLYGSTTSIHISHGALEKTCYELEHENNLTINSSFTDQCAVLPRVNKSFTGHRILQEYFANQRRFLFFELEGLDEALSMCDSNTFDIVIESSQSNPDIAEFVNKSSIKLFCSPAVNLFSSRTDRIHLNNSQFEYHIVVDRARPMDLEVYSVESVKGHGTQKAQEQDFYPFYSEKSQSYRDESSKLRRFYTVMRKPRKLSSKQKHIGPRSNYVGSEVYISLVDGDETEVPFSAQLKQLSMDVLCTNRDLPLHMPVGKGSTDFVLELGDPVKSIRCVNGVTKPLASRAHGDTAWRLIGLLKSNYLSIADMEDDEQNATESFKKLISLYIEPENSVQLSQIDGIVKIQTKACMKTLFIDNNFSMARGKEVTVELDENSFDGAGVFLFGHILERFFTHTCSINSFSETVLHTTQRGEIMRWPPILGQRELI